MILALVGTLANTIITLPGSLIEDATAGASSASLDILNTGLIIGSGNVNYLSDVWVTPTSKASNYEVRATVQSGSSLSSGTTGSWLALSSSRNWTLSVTGNNAKNTSLLIEIRLANSGVVVKSGTYILSVDSSS